MKITYKYNFWRLLSFVVIVALIWMLLFINRTEVIGNADSAATVVKAMGVGWNLGNTLDAYSRNQDAYVVNEQKREKYQVMAVYTTKKYSGWDASPALYISKDRSEFTLEWNIRKLNSDINQQSGTFSFQVINQEIGDTGSNTLDFTVTKAEFQKKDGSVVNLNDMLGEYSESINNKVTNYITSDLTKLSKLQKATDVVGGTLKIKIKINQFPMPKNPTKTKEQFYETLWGNPVTSKALIDDIKEAGFGAIRIPVTFYNHIDSNGTIDLAWLERVKEVAQYVIDNDMYCIINLHHDTGTKGWLKADPTTIKDNMEKFNYIWKQISDYMVDIDNKLLFEGYNELLNENNKWSWAGEDSYKVANDFNQAFVNTVRSSGGNNAERCLIVNTYAASAEEHEMKSFVLPTDNIAHRLIVQVHYYGNTQNGILAVAEQLHINFVSEGIPVIIGEAGMNLKSTEAERINYAKYLVTTTKEREITVFWWDDGNYANRAGAISNYGLYDRHAMKWYYPKIVEALVSVSK